MNNKASLQLGVCLSVLTMCSFANAGSVNVATAANFTTPMKEIVELYKASSNDEVLVSFGSTGGFYAQIKNGAPFDVLVSADAKTPTKLSQEGLAIKETQFTYAIGRLVLWSATKNLVKNETILLDDSIEHIAIANPKVAVYGVSAQEMLTKLGLTNQVKPKLVYGDTIGKAFQFVKTGNAEVGFLALSQVSKNGQLTGGSVWMIPQNLYSPIHQDLVQLKRAEKNKSASKFVKFMKESPEVKAICVKYGYALAQ